jgi:hypothetical protein
VFTQCRQRNFSVLCRRDSLSLRQSRVGPQNARGLATSKHRWFVVALALAAASAFAMSVQAGRWWTIGDVEVGPFGTRSPFAGPGDLSWAGGSVRWQRFGVATGAAGLIAMLVLVVVAGAVAANRVPRLSARTALIAIATASLAAVAFVLARPDNALPFTLARGVGMFAAAAVLGAIAAVGALRLGARRRSDAR